MKYFNWKHGTKVTVGRSWGAKIISTTIECFATFVCVYIRMWWMCDRKRIIYLLFAAPLMLVQKKRDDTTTTDIRFFSLIFLVAISTTLCTQHNQAHSIGIFCVCFFLLSLSASSTHTHTCDPSYWKSIRMYDIFSVYVLNCSSLMVNVWIETTLRSIRNRISKLNTHPSF